MRFRLGVPALIGIVGLCAGSSLLACGDKFLVAGRGARFQRGGARTTVVIYAPPSSSLHGDLRNLPVDKVLTLGGYRPAAAASKEELQEALKERGPDVILADVADARSIEGQFPPGPAGPIILPVLNKPTRQELSEARKTWGVALKAPASGDSLLDAVDEAVEFRAKAIKNASLKH